MEAPSPIANSSATEMQVCTVLGPGSFNKKVVPSLLRAARPSRRAVVLGILLPMALVYALLSFTAKPDVNVLAVSIASVVIFYILLISFTIIAMNMDFEIETVSI